MAETVEELRGQRGWSSRRTARSGCAPPTSATRKDRVARQVRTASTPTSLPTSPTTATSSLRGFDRLIDVWGADHHGSGPSLLKPACEALGHDPRRARGHARPAGRSAWRPGRMSKRPGNIVDLVDLVDDVGPDVMRLLTFLLSRSTPRRPSTSTWSRAQSNENPVFYVQYAHARIRVDRPQGGRARASNGARSPTSTSRCSCTSASSSCCAALSELPEVVALRARRPGAAQDHDLGARAGRPVPRLLPRLLRDRRACRRSSPRPASGWSRRRASGSPSASTCSACRAPEAM